jgi:hypothetical protein
MESDNPESVRDLPGPYRTPRPPLNLANYRRNLNKINKLQQKSPSGLNVKCFIINNLQEWR